MKKKIFLMLPCIAAVAIATFVGKKTLESHAFGSNVLLTQNVEALSAGESSQKVCDNKNGYRSWATTPKHSLDVKTEFYDCCYVLRQGYSPEGNCN